MKELMIRENTVDPPRRVCGRPHRRRASPSGTPRKQPDEKSPVRRAAARGPSGTEHEAPAAPATLLPLLSFRAQPHP